MNSLRAKEAVKKGKKIEDVAAELAAED